MGTGYRADLELDEGVSLLDGPFSPLADLLEPCRLDGLELFEIGQQRVSESTDLFHRLSLASPVVLEGCLDELELCQGR